MRLVYVAGPYRGITPEAVALNIQSATKVATLVALHGDFPVTPHLCTKNFERLLNLPDEFYLEGTMELMRRCNAVVLCPGWPKSSGTLAEIAEAKRLGISVYDSVEWMYGTTDTR